MVSGIGKFSVKAAAASDVPMIFTIRTTAVNQTFQLPCTDSNALGNPNCQINWGDGTTTTLTNAADTPNKTRTYTAASGTDFTVTVTGTLRVFAFSNASHAPMMRTVTQWGTVGLKKINMTGAVNYNTMVAGMFADVASTLEDLSGYWEGTGTTATAIPSGLFTGLNALTNLSRAIYGRTAINTVVPADLIENLPALQTVQQMFRGCSVLPSAPPRLPTHDNLTNAEEYIRSCPNLTSLPSGTFRAPKVTNYLNVFRDMGGLTAAAIDNFLIDIDTYNTATGTRTINYSNSYPYTHNDAQRSTAGLAAVNSLIAKGWTRTGTYNDV